MPTFRTDIQALRAIAILLVLGYHVWPAWVPGGYVGVDVFFVLSGYLITGHLIREVNTTGRVDLPNFYSRRARRLLPAASLILVLVGVGAYMWMPSWTWTTTATDMAASTLYAENWVLVRRTVDYLAQDQAPSPLQHFWSLAVEEQFYLGWPLLMAWGGRQGRRQPDESGRGPNVRLVRRAYAWSMTALCAVSFATALYFVHSNPSSAYFSSATCLWEIGLGGLVALWAPSAVPLTQNRQLLPRQEFPVPAIAVSPSWFGSSWARTLGPAAGLTAVLSTGFMYTPQVPFPGVAALLPTLGAAAFIFAGEGMPAVGQEPLDCTSHALARVLAHPWIQYVGEISYSLYLAHWPAVVLFPYIAGRPMETDGWLDGLHIMLVSWALAHVCKRGWEDLFRASPNAGSPGVAVATARPTCPSCSVQGLPKTSAPAARAAGYKGALALVVACMCTTLIASVGLALQASPLKFFWSLRSLHRNSSAVGSPGDHVLMHPGAEAWVRDALPRIVPAVLPLSDVIPSIDAAANDNGPTSTSPGKLCISGFAGTDVRTCPPVPAANITASLAVKPRIVLLGDSHAAHWLPALNAAIVESNWTAISLAKGSCMPTNVSVARGPKPFTDCREWVDNAVAWILSERPSAVIFSSSPRYSVLGLEANASRTAIATGVVELAKIMANANISVLAIKHTPFHQQSLPACLSTAASRTPNIIDSTKQCTSSATDVRFEGFLSLASRMYPNLHLLDFDDAFCDDSGACPPIIGNVIVYRDAHHLTATYAESLGPALRRRLAATLPDPLPKSLVSKKP